MGEARSDDAVRAAATHRAHTRSLFWRLALVNVSVLVAVALLLALAPVTISVPVRPTAASNGSGTALRS